MKSLLFSLGVLFSCTMLTANPPSDDIKLSPMRGNEKVLMYRTRPAALDTTNLDGRLSSFTPLYLIYPNQPVDEAQALALVKELGIDAQLKNELSAGVGVVNPTGNAYDAKADLQVYKDVIDSLRVISNLKLIGIGNGATFINQHLAPVANEVAGIVSINGKAGKVQKQGGVPVPAFVVGSGAANVAKPYIAVNAAERTAKNAHMQIYANASEPLLQVVVSEAGGQTLGEIFNDAWNSVLSKNYRYNNFRHTFYEGAQFGQYGPYELEPFMMLEEWGVKRNCVVNRDGFNRSATLWFEYIPQGVESAAPKSVPLVLLLHGNNNDPRTQAETSGWIELAAKEKIFVAELEWQGKPGFDAMGHDGIESTVGILLQKYPQIDPSRIYTEGLSAGAMTSSALGVKKSHLFAAIGAMSGGLFPGNTAFGGDAILSEAIQKRGYVETAYIGVFGTDDTTIRYPKGDDWKGNSVVNAWKIYETMNGMDVVEQYDFNRDPAFGQPMRDRQTIETNKGITMEVGSLYKGEVPLMKIVAVLNYGHWNFKPAAQLMWEHFKHFSRDVETKKLIYHP